MTIASYSQKKTYLLASGFIEKITNAVSDNLVAINFLKVDAGEKLKPH